MPLEEYYLLMILLSAAQSGSVFMNHLLGFGNQWALSLCVLIVAH